MLFRCFFLFRCSLFRSPLYLNFVKYAYDVFFLIFQDGQNCTSVDLQLANAVLLKKISSLEESLRLSRFKNVNFESEINALFDSILNFEMSASDCIFKFQRLEFKAQTDQLALVEEDLGQVCSTLDVVHHLQWGFEIWMVEKRLGCKWSGF